METGRNHNPTAGHKTETLDDIILKNGISGVNKTLFNTLLPRAYSSLDKESAFKDPKADEFRTKLGISDTQLRSFVEEFRKVGAGSVGDPTKMMTTRPKVFDDAAVSFIKSNPNCTVINLGAGLCTRYYRVGADQDTRIRWLEVDMPAVIEMRDRIEQKKGNHELVASYVNDEFIRMIKDSIEGKVLFIAGGLMLYLKEEEVKRLFCAIADNFKGSEMLVEVARLSYLNKVKSEASIKKLQLPLSGGLDDFNDIEKLGKGIRLLGELQVPGFEQIMSILRIKFE